MLRNKIIAGVVGTALLLSPLTTHAAATQDNTSQGKMIDGHVYAPVRYMAEQIGAQIEWNQASKTVTVTLGDKRFSATVGPFVKLFDGVVYVQFREMNHAFFGEEKLDWDPGTLTASSDHMSVSLPLPAPAADQVILYGKMVNNQVFMPLKAAADGIGATTTWDQTTQTATVKKDGKILQAKTGPFVKLFDNRIYIQFRAFNETFFKKDKIGWSSTYLFADSEHFVVYVKPLTDEEAIKLATPSTANTKWQQFVKETSGFGVEKSVRWLGLNSYEAVYYAEWRDSGSWYDNNTSMINVTMVKKGNTWIRTHLKYHKGWLLEPH